MNSRDAILTALRRAARGAGPPPTPAFATLRHDDPVAAFAESLAAAGGTCLDLSDHGNPSAALHALPLVAGARRLLSAVPALASRYGAGPPRQPRDLNGLDLAVLAGSPAVAESGAVWCTPSDDLSRAALFLAEHVLLVVPRDAVVDTLHEAYARIEAGAQPFACFVAGPSKTADIEQSLVIGAHGPRSLSVALIGGPA